MFTEHPNVIAKSVVMALTARFHTMIRFGFKILKSSLNFGNPGKEILKRRFLRLRTCWMIRIFLARIVRGIDVTITGWVRWRFFFRKAMRWCKKKVTKMRDKMAKWPKKRFWKLLRAKLENSEFESTNSWIPLKTFRLKPAASSELRLAHSRALSNKPDSEYFTMLWGKSKSRFDLELFESKVTRHSLANLHSIVTQLVIGVSSAMVGHQAILRERFVWDPDVSALGKHGCQYEDEGH